MKAIKNIFLLIILIDLFQMFSAEDQNSPPKKGTDYPDITCGKSKPKKPKDCTNYGTDSGMLCCWIKKKMEFHAIFFQRKWLMEKE